MKKISLFLLLVLFSVFASGVEAKVVEIPEVSGDYADPENKDQRVRVFVHKVKDMVAENMACVSDPDSEAVVGPTGWKLPESMEYRLNMSVPGGIGSANWTEIAKRSFAVWSQATGGLVKFTEGPSTKVNRQSGDGQNVLAWGRTNGSALAVTYTRYRTDTKEVVDVDTIMNQKFAWSWADNVCGSPNSYDAQNILTHELGHWMGLNDHYTVEYAANTMYGYGAKGETQKDTLTSGDIAGLGAIYN